MRNPAFYVLVLALVLGVSYFTLRDGSGVKPAPQPEAVVAPIVEPIETTKDFDGIDTAPVQLKEAVSSSVAPPVRQDVVATQVSQPLPEVMQQMANKHTAAAALVAAIAPQREAFAAEPRDEVWANDIENRLRDFVMRHVNDQPLVSAPLSFECRTTLCELQTSETRSAPGASPVNTPDLRNVLFNPDRMYGGGETFFRQSIRQEQKACASNRDAIDCIIYFQRVE